MKKLPFINTMISGAIGKKFVIKHYRNDIVFTKFPDMTGIKASPIQNQLETYSKKQLHLPNYGGRNLEKEQCIIMPSGTI